MWVFTSLFATVLSMILAIGVARDYVRGSQK